MGKPNQYILIFSASFQAGAVLTPKAFIKFLKSASRDEVSQCDFHFLPYSSELIGDYEYYSASDLPGVLLQSWETH